MTAGDLRRLLAVVPNDAQIFFMDEEEGAYAAVAAAKVGDSWIVDIELLAYRDFDGVHEVEGDEET